MSLLPVFLALALCGGVLLALTTPSPAVRRSRGSPRARPARRWAPAGAARGGVRHAVGRRVWRRGPRWARTPTVERVRRGFRRCSTRCTAGGVCRLTGVLDEDASAGANGVRLRLAVRRFADHEVDGAETVALTVGGALAGTADGAMARRPRHPHSRDASASGALPQSGRRLTTDWRWPAAA